MASRDPVSAGRVLALVYGFFTVAAGARSAVQLGTHASRAPLAYGLSALAALTYLIATVAIARADSPRATGALGVSVATTVCRLEIVGVLAVGSLSLAIPSRFPEATVWSEFGAGYGCVPAVLPLFGLLWLRSRAGQLDLALSKR